MKHHQENHCDSQVSCCIHASLVKCLLLLCLQLFHQRRKLSTVLPTYCTLHLLQKSKYIMCLSLQLKLWLITYFLTIINYILFLVNRVREGITFCHTHAYLTSLTLTFKWSNQSFWHSHKKRKDSPETRVAPLILLLEIEISGVAVQSIHRNSQKWRLLLGTAR